MTCPRACALPCPLALAPPSAAPPMGAAANAPPDHGQRRHVATPARAHTLSHTLSLSPHHSPTISLTHTSSVSYYVTLLHQRSTRKRPQLGANSLRLSAAHTHYLSFSLARCSLAMSRPLPRARAISPSAYTDMFTTVMRAGVKWKVRRTSCTCCHVSVKRDQV